LQFYDFSFLLATDDVHSEEKCSDWFWRYVLLLIVSLNRYWLCWPGSDFIFYEIIMHMILIYTC